MPGRTVVWSTVQDQQHTASGAADVKATIRVAQGVPHANPLGGPADVKASVRTATQPELE